ncbi:ABC transporter permease [Kitasatospora sp. NPDC002040]|uniref:ABC transporter permease n=1 Tax=Kitasatospora sp. NPDC002040 TaxID=3154661 RepID=UPI003321CBA7
MSAVWRAARAAVKRRRLQTVVIGLVVLCSTTTVLLALGLLDAVSNPFDKAFEQQRGAQATVVFDAGRVTPGQLADTAARPGVQAAAGPFDRATTRLAERVPGLGDGVFQVVGRADPGGPVDRPALVGGRWAAAPGEIVLNQETSHPVLPGLLGSKVRLTDGPELTVVGVYTSMSGSADAWAVPEQMAALHPTARQMLYRFDSAGTEQELDRSLDRATEGLPAGARTAVNTSFVLERAFSASAKAYLPFMGLFGVLGLAVSVLIVGNVVSGAVVSGFRHIGVLKALGFTPNQVVGVYLTMVSLPAVVGAALGTALGAALAEPVLRVAFQGVMRGTAEIGISPWVYLVGLLGLPVLVLLAALVPALRAHRLPAARAISAGSAPRSGRALRVQQWLGGTRLPRAVSLGLGQPLARPARTALTMAAILLGVVTVTLTTGLTSTMVAYAEAGKSESGPRLAVWAGRAGFDQTEPKLTDRQAEELLRSLPGAARVSADAITEVGLAGYTQPGGGFFRRGDQDPGAARQIAEGRMPTGPGELAASPTFLSRRGLSVGDRVTLQLDGRRTEATVVGRTIDGDGRFLYSTWSTLAELDPAAEAAVYQVQLKPGTDVQAYIDAVRAADPGLYPQPADDGSLPAETVVSFASVFTVLLTVVACLGVFNTVLLNTRERRRDLGMLKSIGMTPRQVTVMFVTSMAALGLVAGLIGIPVGMVAHRLLVDHVGAIDFPAAMKDVWHLPGLALLGLAGVAIAVLGAFVPARSAARLTIAKVLHNE